MAVKGSQAQIIAKQINQNIWSYLSEDIKNLLGPEIADILLSIEDEKNQIKFFKLLPDNRKVEVFSHMEDHFQEFMFEELPLKTIKYILLNLEPDDRTAILEEVNKELQAKLLSLLPKDELKESRELLSYPEESVGRLMTPEFVALSPDWTVKRALNYIRKVAQDKETILTINVVNENDYLLDDVRLSRLILASPKKYIKDIMDHNFTALNAYDDREVAVKTMQKYDRYVLPVIDNGVLVGIVTSDDVFDVAEEETTEDIQKQSGITPFEINYASASIFEIFKKRVGWLMLLLFGSFISSTIIAHFSSAIESIVALSFFIAILIGAGGNVGTQSSALVIRALALGDLQLSQWWNVFLKELVLGILLGLSLGIALYLRAYFMEGAKIVSVVAGTSIFFVVLWANLIGALLPLGLMKMKMDPAVVSSPLITTIIDLSGLFIYFTMAKLILGI